MRAEGRGDREAAGSCQVVHSRSVWALCSLERSVTKLEVQT